ncbi:hypothetical protein DM01DRAFT_1408629 [Hesseltinella vesiculosa]|uniref:C3H1-type domain-containing protein n=1 Tax=Hesseltinella vesiculosa TaxID=101127 RepID=A0A1X2GE49_9FUNG|nr:hypothetical protein DM01DRAFT_1408629 [Hesseltinella vesiculosa]
MYYCDFCQCSFPDNINNRKKHNRGLTHIQNKKNHYDWYRDPQLVIQEHLQKPPCRRFRQTRACDFGLNCIYSHVLFGPQGEPIYPPELTEWLHARSMANLPKPSSQKKRKKQPHNKQAGRSKVYQLPPGWQSSDLPPSLQPPPIDIGWDHAGGWG